MPTKTKLRINKTLSKIKVSVNKHWKLPQINPIFANLFEEIPIQVFLQIGLQIQD